MSIASGAGRQSPHWILMSRITVGNYEDQRTGIIEPQNGDVMNEVQKDI